MDFQHDSTVTKYFHYHLIENKNDLDLPSTQYLP